MGTLVQRPRFFEGQLLGADDLTAGLEYARSQEARHDRLVHTWGIASGLALTATPKEGKLGAFVVVKLTSGLAIDGTGREIVVPEDVALDEAQFFRRNVAVGDPEARYPVLLAGADSPGLPPPVGRSCTAAQAGRTVESYKLTFGAPGDEHALDRQTLPAVDQGAGGAPGAPRWWILLGFVGWDATQRKFTAVADSFDGVARRYVGIHADEVIGQGGDLVLRSRQAGTAMAPLLELAQGPLGGMLGLGVDDGHGASVPKLIAYTGGVIESDAGALTLRAGPPATVGKPMLALAETDAGGTLQFGLQDAGSNPSKLMTVDEQGNLTIAGIFSGQLATANFQSIKVESGTAGDGTILPLPDGVTEDQVASGRVRLHMLVWPHPPGAAPWDANLTLVPDWIGAATDARVEASTRRVRCRVRWIGFPAGGGKPVVETLAGACRFLVLAVAQPPEAS